MWVFFNFFSCLVIVIGRVDMCLEVWKYGGFFGDCVGVKVYELVDFDFGIEEWIWLLFCCVLV